MARKQYKHLLFHVHLILFGFINESTIYVGTAVHISKYTAPAFWRTNGVFKVAQISIFHQQC